MTVLPKWYVDACFIDPADVAKCPCQYGRCGHCHQLGKHAGCNTRNALHGRPPREPLTRVVGRRGNPRAALWPKWGRSCR